MATKIMTAYGNAQLDTAQKKFGTASGLFDGSGDYIDTLDHEDFYVGNGDFTVDFWVRRNTIGALQTICAQSASDGSSTSMSIQIRTNADDTIGCFIFAGGSGNGINSSIKIADTNWHHIALVRYSNIMTLYIDGTARGTLNVTGITLNNSANKFAIGRSGEYNGQYFNGWIDEFRFSKGIARWTSNFTPPTGPHTADAYTVLLLHMDGTDGSTSFIDDSESSAPSPLANTKANIGGAWKQAVDGHVKIDGIWKPISSIHTKIDGVWKQA